MENEPNDSVGDRIVKVTSTEASTSNATQITLTLNQEKIPFTSESATTFADLARDNDIMNAIFTSGANSLSQDILSHTLSEYGPIITENNSRSTPADTPLLAPYYVSQPNISSEPMGPVLVDSQANLSSLHRPSEPPAPTAISNYFPPTNPMNRPGYSHDSTSNLSVQTPDVQLPPNDGLLYSPPPVPASSFSNPPVNPNTGRPMTDSTPEEFTSGRIPKRPEAKQPFANLPMLELQRQFRKHEAQMRRYQKMRDILERDINSMTRNSKGRNLEIDPIFCRKKDEKHACEKDIDKYKNLMKILQEKLYVEFSYKIDRSDSGKNSGPMPQIASTMRRAKMSTTPYRDNKAHLSLRDKPSTAKKLLLDLKDTATWCQLCDLHLNSLREYSRHLHSDDHQASMKKTTPWRTYKFGDQVDRRRSYDLMKAICAQLSNELDKDFRLLDVDAALNPSIKSRIQTLKERNLARERGRFSEDDILFKVRGYDYIVPTKGFYCNLCNKPLCDHLEFEQHIKSYEHVHAHFKSIALDPKHENDVRSEYEKSYKKKFPPIEEIPKRQLTDSSEKVRSPRKDQTGNKRKAPSDAPAVGESYVPDIIPINQHRPAALKRLRTTIDDIKKTVTANEASSVSSISDSISDLEVDSGDEPLFLSQSHSLDIGDNASPFPEYQISACGNNHDSILRDKRLAMPIQVKLTPINMDDYKEMLLTTGSVWSRINCLMMKREKVVSLDADTVSRVQTEPTFFTTNGQQMPVKVEEEEDDEKACSLENYMGMLENFFCEK